MEILWAVLLFLLGVALIVKGGDLFVDAATWMAEASGLPKFLIGATVVSIATTLPEVIVSVMAAFERSTEMAIGNAVGSVTANIGIIMAISLLFMPTVIRRRQLAFKGTLMVVSAAALWLLSRDGALTLAESLVLLALFAGFLTENIMQARGEGGAQEKAEVRKGDLGRNVLKFVLGAAMLVIGSRLLVDNGTYLAELLGVPERVIAVTMVAIGTSLPELVTCITAIVKKQSSLSVGNILGANIIDITIILPLCAMISGGSLPVDLSSALYDMPFCLAETALAVVPTLILKRFTRFQGAAMLALYAAYLALTVF